MNNGSQMTRRVLQDDSSDDELLQLPASQIHHSMEVDQHRDVVYADQMEIVYAPQDDDELLHQSPPEDAHDHELALALEWEQHHERSHGKHVLSTRDEPAPKKQRHASPVGMEEAEYHVATTFSGAPLYLRKRKVEIPLERVYASVSLTSTSIYRLLHEMDTTSSVETPPSVQTVQETVLWADKYKPRRFVDLIGRPYVHRKILSWIKAWDKCVFKKLTQKRFTADKQKPGVQDPLERPERRVSSLLPCHWL
jgi:hypothetical protein